MKLPAKRKAGRPRKDEFVAKNFRKKGRRGRPPGPSGPVLDPEDPDAIVLLEYLREMSLLGAPRHLIAQGLDISDATLDNWEKKYPEISLALEEGNIGAGKKVAAALFRRATGYSISRKSVTVTTTVDGTEEKVTTEEVHIPADVKAATFWLERRFPEVWAPKEAGAGGEGGEIVEVEFEVVPDDDPEKYLPRETVPEPVPAQVPAVPGRLGFGSAFKR